MNNVVHPDIFNLKEDVAGLIKENKTFKSDIDELKKTSVELSSMVSIYVENSNKIQSAIFDIKKEIFQMNNPKKEQIELEIMQKQLNEKVKDLEKFKDFTENEFAKINANRNILSFIIRNPWIIILSISILLSLELSSFIKST